MVVDLFRSRKSLEAEVVALRHQLNVLLRRSGHKRPALSRFDRLVFVGLYRFVPSVLDAVTIVRPETIMRWHRAGFRAFWHWKSRAKRAGRPQAPLEVRWTCFERVESFPEMKGELDDEAEVYAGICG